MPLPQQTDPIDGLVLVGQAVEAGGRGIAGARLRTAAERSGFRVVAPDIVPYLTQEQIFELVEAFIPTGIKFVGLSTSWIDVKKNHGSYSWLTADFFRSFKERFPHLLLITGGHQSHRFDSVFSYIDYHFQGFSDVSFVEFLKLINGQPNGLKFKEYKNAKIIESNVDYPVINPDDIETVFVKEDGFLPHQPLPIELSRGCIFRCTFCRHPFQGKKDYDSYQRSPESLARELKRNYELFGTTRYSVMDDTINDSIEKLDRLRRAIDLAQLPKFEFVGYIKPELIVTKPEMIQMLADLGLRGAYLGIESFKNATRRAIGRGVDIERVKESVFKLAEVNNRQVQIYGSFIVGLPHESPDEVVETAEFLIANAKNFCHAWEFHPLAILNQTVTVHLSSEKSSLDKNPGKFNYVFPDDSKKYHWKNEFYTYDQAVEHAAAMMRLSRDKMYYGGWRIAGCWHLGMSEHEITNSQSRPEFEQQLVEQLKRRTSLKYMSLINVPHMAV